MQECAPLSCLKGRVCPAVRQREGCWDCVLAVRVDCFLCTHSVGGPEGWTWFPSSTSKYIPLAALVLSRAWGHRVDVALPSRCVVVYLTHHRSWRSRTHSEPEWITVKLGTRERDACLKVASGWVAYLQRQVGEFATFFSQLVRKGCSVAAEVQMRKSWFRLWGWA